VVGGGNKGDEGSEGKKHHMEGKEKMAGGKTGGILISGYGDR